MQAREALEQLALEAGIRLLAHREPLLVLLGCREHAQRAARLLRREVRGGPRDEGARRGEQRGDHSPTRGVQAGQRRRAAACGATGTPGSRRRLRTAVEVLWSLLRQARTESGGTRGPSAFRSPCCDCRAACHPRGPTPGAARDGRGRRRRAGRGRPLPRAGERGQSVPAPEAGAADRPPAGDVAGAGRRARRACPGARRPPRGRTGGPTPGRGSVVEGDAATQAALRGRRSPRLLARLRGDALRLAARARAPGVPRAAAADEGRHGPLSGTPGPVPRLRSVAAREAPRPGRAWHPPPEGRAHGRRRVPARRARPGTGKPVCRRRCEAFAPRARRGGRIREVARGRRRCGPAGAPGTADAAAGSGQRRARGGRARAVPGRSRRLRDTRFGVTPRST